MERNGKQFYELLNQRYQIFTLKLTILNFLYMTATVDVCTAKNSILPFISLNAQPSRTGAFHDLSLYKDVLAAFITKMSIIIIA